MTTIAQPRIDPTLPRRFAHVIAAALAGAAIGIAATPPTETVSPPQQTENANIGDAPAVVAPVDTPVERQQGLGGDFGPLRAD